jgi:hypothetical protein
MDSYFVLKRVVDWCLRNKMGMAGNALMDKREQAWGSMVLLRGGKRFIVPPIELYDDVRARLLATPKVAAVSMDTEMGSEMAGTFKIDVHGIPGWPSPMTHDDCYQAAQFIKRNPELSALVSAYEEDFGGSGDPEPAVGGGDLMEFLGDAPPRDLGDQPFELTRGMVFMIIDLMLNSVPKGHGAFYINDVDMEIMPFKPSHPVPKGMTMARLLQGGVARDTGARRSNNRLSMVKAPTPSDDDFNEGVRARGRRGR